MQQCKMDDVFIGWLGLAEILLFPAPAGKGIRPRDPAWLGQSRPLPPFRRLTNAKNSHVNYPSVVSFARTMVGVLLDVT